MMNFRQQSGISLIEVLVTMLVMTIGLLGIAGMQSTSLKDGLDTAQRSQATWLVTELVERARANPYGRTSGGYVTNQLNIGSATACGGAKPAKLCADSSAGDAANNCTPVEVAEYDVWEVFCGNVEANTVANSTDSLKLETVDIACTNPATCTDNSDFEVKLSWISQSVNNSQILTDAQKQAQETQSITMTVRL